MLKAFSVERIYDERFYKLEGMDTFAIFRDVRKKQSEKEALEQQHKLLQNDLLQLGLANTQQLNIINPQIMELLSVQQKLIQQALEQQKLTLLNMHPELMQQIEKPKQKLEDREIQLLLEQKSNSYQRR